MPEIVLTWTCALANYRHILRAPWCLCFKTRLVIKAVFMTGKIDLGVTQCIQSECFSAQAVSDAHQSSIFHRLGPKVLPVAVFGRAWTSPRRTFQGHIMSASRMTTTWMCNRVDNRAHKPTPIKGKPLQSQVIRASVESVLWNYGYYHSQIKIK